MQRNRMAFGNKVLDVLLAAITAEENISMKSRNHLVIVLIAKAVREY
jgi:hypothetical protein